VVLHVASPVVEEVWLNPASWMMVLVSKPLFARFITVVPNVSVQKFKLFAGMTSGGDGVNTNWFGEVPPAGLLLVQFVNAHVVVIVASPAYGSGDPPTPAPGSASAAAQLARLPVCLQARSSRSAVAVSCVPPVIVPAPTVICTLTVLPMPGKFGVGET